MYMTTKNKPLLGQLRFIKPPPYLYTKITTRIKLLEQRNLQIRLAFQSIGALTSLILLIPAYQFASAEWMRSEFGNYLALLLSDGALALTYSKELALSLIESAPLLGISALVTTLLVTLGTLKASAYNFFSLQKIRTV
jgi:hypothetical protein